MLNRLSKEQTSLSAQISSIWTENAFVRKDFNKPLIEDSLAWLYGLVGLPKPKIYYAQSPPDCQRIASELKAERNSSEWKNLNSQIKYLLEYEANRIVSNRVYQQIRKQVWGQAAYISMVKLQMEVALKEKTGDGFENFSSDGMRAFQWCAYYDFFKEIGIMKNDKFLRYRDFLFNSGIFMSVYEESLAIVCPNPEHAVLDDNFRLHCPDGPALSWDDGYKLYFLNGVRVSKVFFMPDAELDPVLLLKEKNAEARREIIRRLGIERVIKDLGAEVIDRWRDYELLTLDIPGMKYRPTYLKMLNPSVKVWHIEGVPPNIRTCEEALAWRDSEIRYIIPEQLT